MKNDYAHSRVQDALEKSGGDQVKAQKLVFSWLENDQSLLAGLAAPHMKGIVAHAVAHAASGAKSGPREARDEVPGEFGAALLDTLAGAGKAERFGEPTVRRGIAPEPPPKASQEHIDAIHKLAGIKDKKD